MVLLFELGVYLLLVSLVVLKFSVFLAMGVVVTG